MPIAGRLLLAKPVEPHELAISQSDLPPGFGLVDRSERRRIDVSADARELGWIKGYQVSFARIGGLLNTTRIEQHISFYPAESMNQVLQLSMEGFSADEQLTISNIGDRSFAFKRDSSSGRTYWVVFQKKNIHETFSISGTITDFELLKELARKAESKIP